MFIMFGGNYFVASNGKIFAFRIDGDEVFSLRASDDGYLSINAAIWTATGELSCRIDSNDILPNLATLGDLTCSIQAKEVEISSRKNEALLSLRYDRKPERKLISTVISKWPRSLSSALKIDKTEKVRGFIRSTLDSDGLCPVITIRANIHTASVPLKTLGKGINADFRKLGFDKATLTGLDAGEGGIRFVYANTEQEKIYVGSQ